MTILPARPSVVGTALVGMALLAVLLPAPSPADALSVACGKALVGVGVDYAAGLDNGHPDDHALDGWNGRPALSQLTQDHFVLGRVVGGIEAGYAILDAAPFEIDGVVQKGIKVGVGITLTVMNIIIRALDVAIMELEHQNARVDACGDTLGGDFVDVLFTAMVEEELAYLDLDGNADPGATDQEAGVQLVPSAILMLPKDGHPAWQRDASLYTGLPGHSDLAIPYVDGFQNAQYVGVATIVRNQIAHLEAVGVDTGTTTTHPDPNGGSDITVYGAGDLWKQGMTAMAEGDARLAHTRFAQAYRTAVSQLPPPGGTYPTAATPPPGDPTPEPTTPPPSPWPSATPAPSPSPTPTPTPSGNPWG